MVPSSPRSRCSTPDSAMNFTWGGNTQPPSAQSDILRRSSESQIFPDTASEGIGVSFESFFYGLITYHFRIKSEFHDSETDDEVVLSAKTSRRVVRGFQCDRIGGDAATDGISPNQMVIDTVGSYFRGWMT
jgi:hypothetical protein